ncbi:MAG: PQQ-dependent sugar dehydrogenase [Asticcacaulis sp.]
MMKALSRISQFALCLALAGCGGGGSGSSGNSGGSVNHAPVITSAASASVAENATGTVYTAQATDADNNALSYAISGTDAGLFTIMATSGALSFSSPPDFETPRDANHDNVYEVTLSVSDGKTSVNKAISLTVTDRAGAVSTRRVATGFNAPVFLTGRGDGSGKVLVVQKGGLVRVLDPQTGTVDAMPFLDVTSQVSTDGERGLLGLALAPDFATSGLFYIYMTAPNGDIQIRRFTATASGASGAGDIIFSTPHARNNHVGGWIGFDPNGLLVFATGDGGGAGDPDGNAQNKNALLGKILRIDPRSDAYPADANRDYSIPVGNPFAVAGGAPEIWHYGVRNPFRNSFDMTTGIFYVGDVGQELWEEIDVALPGQNGLNYGWKIREGAHDYTGGASAGLTDPVLEYPHGNGAKEGASLIGGYVYRGPIASLQGQYIFGDYVNKRIWALPASQLVPGITLSNAAFTDLTAAFTPSTGAIGNILSFGEDDADNLYILDGGGNIFRVEETGE